MKATDQELLEALQTSCGIYSRAAKSLGVSRQAVRERVENNPEIKKAVEQMQEAIADEAEHGLIELIRSTNEQIRFNAVKYYLSTKGKGRGYVEKQQLEHQGPYILHFDKDDENL